MKEFCDISEKFESIRVEFLRYAKGYEVKKNHMLVHTKKLQNYLHEMEDCEDKKLIVDTIELLKEKQDSYEQMGTLINELLNELNALLETSSCEEDGVKDSMSGIKVLEAQERVRKRIARELHDSTVQSLTGLIYKTEFCAKLLEKDPTRVRLELQIMLASLKTVIEDMRSTIYNLRPTMVSNESLNFCVKKYIDNLGIKHPNITFKYEELGEYKKVKDIYCFTLLRIIQEACQNAAKHADAKFIQINIEYKEDILILSIVDNGQGFEMEEVGERTEQVEHFGLSIMKERAQLMNANLMIKSSKNKGTVVRIEVPEVYSDEGDNDGSN